MSLVDQLDMEVKLQGYTSFTENTATLNYTNYNRNTTFKVRRLEYFVVIYFDG